MKYEITAELDLKKLISELCEVAHALYECADHLSLIESMYADKEEQDKEVLNGRENEKA